VACDKPNNDEEAECNVAGCGIAHVFQEFGGLCVLDGVGSQICALNLQEE
jgi:hypothetical protein